MRFDAYYLIRPLPSSSSRFLEFGESVAGRLTAPQLWRNGEGGRTGWWVEEHALAVKLLFLASLHHRFGPTDAFQPFLVALPINVESFDRFWTLERHEIDHERTDVERLLEAELVEQMEPTGNALVDGWLENLRRSARRI